MAEAPRVAKENGSRSALMENKFTYGSSCPGAIVLGGDCPENNFSGGNYLVGICQGAVVQGWTDCIVTNVSHGIKNLKLFHKSYKATK